MEYNFDFLAIGDTVTDAFIRLKEASVHCKINKEECEICLRFADKIPYEEVYVIPAVGNSANAAVAAARLGLKSALVANIGKDFHGKECLRVFKEEGVGTKFIRAHKGIKTNYHYVLWYEDDRTILVKHETYPYDLPDIRNPAWLYLTSLGADADSIYPKISEYLKTHPAVKLVFQPGTYQMKMGVEKLRDIYQRTALFFCNREEAQRILGGDEEDIKKLLAGIRALGPKTVVITDGPAGAYAAGSPVSSAEQNSQDEFWFMPPYPDSKPPYERTGAGDAFSSTVTVALAMGMPLKDALRWGPINSMSVVQYVGAREGLLTRAQIEEYLTKAPADYIPRLL